MDTERHPLQVRLITAVTEIDRRRMYGRKLALMSEGVLFRHKPQAARSFDGDVHWECENHATFQEDQFDWPCAEVTALAEVLGVPL